MRKSVLFNILAIWLLLLALVHSENCDQFDEYVVKFQKQYKDNEEKQFRRKVFCENLIQLQQDRRNHPNCTFQINQFSDRTERQLKNHGLKNTPIKIQKKVSEIRQQEVSFPQSLDWRDKDAVTWVKDQGQCGSCWSFAAAAYAESKLIVEGKADTEIDLSEQYLLQCTNYSSCEGGYMHQAMQTVKGGVPTEDQYLYYPYSPYPKDQICNQDEKIHIGEQTFNYNLLDDYEIIKLLQKSPLAISVASENWSYYSSGIFSCHQSDSVDHAVLLVGYTPDYWIIKNQWGSSWGERGYMKISRIPSQNCMVGNSVHMLAESTLYASIIIFLGLFALIL